MDFINFVAAAGVLEACFWPAMAGLVLLTAKLNWSNGRTVALWTLVALGAFYFLWYQFYGVTSLAGVANGCLAFVLPGAMLIWTGAVRRPVFVLLTTSQAPQPRVLSVPRRVGVCLLGLALVLFGSWSLVQDYFRPRLVLEGRVTSAWDVLRMKSGRKHFVSIDGTTVNTTTSMYERLKLKPYVRVEVGRGSDYIYKIEYLSN